MDGSAKTRRKLDAAEMGVVAHLYRGEVYRSTIWRTRLDTTTNWSVVTLGVALSITYSSPQASPLPLVLVGILIIFFLMLEARRYRYFNVWRARCRWLELHFMAPILKEGNLHLEEQWQDRLAEDYLHPAYHVSMWTAIGRRIRRNYFWILLIQTVAYMGKLVVHPTPLESTGQLLERAAIGPLPGWLVLLVGAVYCISWGIIAYVSEQQDAARARLKSDPLGMG
ncbi:DUF2270 domain-containing protein [Paracoccus seriniphilus]|uniref:Uncharacterized membrane protein n=1 Tax=Paracoccus seriniphilus TaxID=184748 RepID=A0A239Q2D7_9RHOB|nr:DUF2270 domain-containing protein [Paracoccus seriniphilus]SNT76117.1 Uncharacterized membrane protein [Paracoccus seriniphilus]